MKSFQDNAGIHLSRLGTCCRIRWIMSRHWYRLLAKPLLICDENSSRMDNLRMHTVYAVKASGTRLFQDFTSSVYQLYLTSREIKRLQPLKNSNAGKDVRLQMIDEMLETVRDGERLASLKCGQSLLMLSGCNLGTYLMGCNAAFIEMQEWVPSSTMKKACATRRSKSKFQTESTSCLHRMC